MSNLTKDAIEIRNWEVANMSADLRLKYRRDPQLRSILNAMFQLMADTKAVCQLGTCPECESTKLDHINTIDGQLVCTLTGRTINH